MNRKAIVVYGVLPALVIAGAATFHRMSRNAELDRQKAAKDAALVTVSMAPVETRPFHGTLAFTGTVLAVDRAEIKAEVSGRVTRVAVREGDRVSRGTMLAMQDEEDLLLSMQVAEAQAAQAQAQQARRDNDRAVALLEKRSVTRQFAQQAETAFHATQDASRAAASNLGLARSRFHKARIASPIAGEVAQRLVQPGEVLAPGQPVFMVVDNRRMEIQADLPAASAASVKVGQKVRFRVAGFAGPFEGAVANVAAAVALDGRTLRVRVELPNADGRLKSGLFAEGEILGNGEVQRPALPVALVRAEGQEAQVYVEEGGIARLRRVTLGPEQDGWRAVEGLAAGVKVVSQGRDQVSEGSRLRIVPEGK
ncbi:MAG: efflux RND transporter periplasmic adaptor subunit [Geothrix sp.]|nr:efflux RND transporter periplasmic adaptor subunit [Geothrix sp.]